MVSAHALVVLGLFTFTTQAYNDKGRAHPTYYAPAQPAPQQQPPPPPPQQQQQCAAQRSIMFQEQMRIDNARSEVAGIDSELNLVRRRMDELNGRRGELQQQMNAWEQRAQASHNNYRQQCFSYETCNDYEWKVDELHREVRPIDDQMAALRNEYGGTRHDIDGLRAEAGNLRNEYQQRNCANLMPGQTAQGDIDRCSWIFTEWNRVATAVNEKANRIPPLRSRYDMLAMQQQSIARRVMEVRDDMQQRCAASPRFRDAQQWNESRQANVAMAQQLDDLMRDATTLRQVRVGY